MLFNGSVQNETHQWMMKKQKLKLIKFTSVYNAVSYQSMKAIAVVNAGWTIKKSKLWVE